MHVRLGAFGGDGQKVFRQKRRPPMPNASLSARWLRRAADAALAQQHLSARDGARRGVKEEEFDPARQAQYAFQSRGIALRGLATESLVEALLNAGPEVADVMEVLFHVPESERRMLASILLKEDEELSAERLDGAVRALRRIHLRRRLEETQRELKKPGVSDDRVHMKELLVEIERLSRALRDPSLAEDGLKIATGNKKSA